MSRLLGALIVLALIVVAGGSVFLATWEIPAPSKTVERVIPDDRFPRWPASPGDGNRRSLMRWFAAPAIWGRPVFKRPKN